MIRGKGINFRDLFGLKLRPLLTSWMRLISRHLNILIYEIHTLQCHSPYMAAQRSPWEHMWKCQKCVFLSVGAQWQETSLSFALGLQRRELLVLPGAFFFFKLLILPLSEIPIESVSESLVVQLCPTLCNLYDCSPLGSSVHGILQARILEWKAIPFIIGSSRPRDGTQVSSIAGRLYHLSHQGSPRCPLLFMLLKGMIWSYSF